MISYPAFEQTQPIYLRDLGPRQTQSLLRESYNLYCSGRIQTMFGFKPHHLNSDFFFKFERGDNFLFDSKHFLSNDSPFCTSLQNDTWSF